MAEPASTLPLPDRNVTLHTAPLADEGKVVLFVEVDAQVTDVITLGSDDARQLALGLLEAIGAVAPFESAWPS